MHKRKSEAGNFMLLFGLVFMSLLACVFYLGIESSSIHQAATALSLRTKEICQAVAVRPTIHRQAAEQFRDLVQATVTTNPIRNVQIVGAKLYMPTMPGSGIDFCFEDDSSCDPATVPAHRPGLEGYSFVDLVEDGSLKCSLDDGSDCTFHADIFDPDPDNDPNLPFPPDLVSNLKNAGNMVGCELQGGLTTLFGRSRMLTSRDVWVKELRGDYNRSNGDLDEIIESYPGLTIAVSTHATTFAGDLRFRFDETARDAAWRKYYDPLYLNAGASPFNFFSLNPPATGDQFNIAGVGISGTHNLLGMPLPGVTGFSRTCGRVDPNGNPTCDDPDEMPRQINGTDYGSLPDCRFMGSADYGYSDAPQPGVNCLQLSDREEMIAACANPMTLLRNTFLSTIVGMAQHDATLRRMTQLVSVGTQNLILNNYNNTESLPAKNNPPKVLVNFGQDLAAPNSSDRYHLPFVTFNAGDEDDPPAKGYGPPAIGGYGFIDPFTSLGVPRDGDDAFMLYESLVAQQLRICYHMYNGYSDGLDRYPITLLNGFNTEEGFDPRFEPEDAYGFEFDLRDDYNNSDTNWAQSCPWSSLSCSMDDSRRLTPMELVSSLGVTQRCPVEVNNLPGHGDNILDDPCSLDLDGDGVVGCPPIDRCPSGNDSADNDGDGVPDVCDPDDDDGTTVWDDLDWSIIDGDGDGVLDGQYDGSWTAIDNCPATPNSNQNDQDDDGVGNKCETSSNPVGFCEKPMPIVWDGSGELPATLDLRPDLVGLFRYLKGDIRGYTGKIAGSPLNTNEGHSGIAPLQPTPSNPDNNYPYGVSDLYEKTKNKDSSILLVIHQRLSKRVKERVSNLMGSGNLAGRIVTVIYMPYDELSTDMHMRAVEDLKEAFNIESDDEETNWDSNEGAVLFTFSPWQKEFNTDHPDYEASKLVMDIDPDLPPSERFRIYWNMLLDTSDYNIALAARNIFHRRINTLKLKF